MSQRILAFGDSNTFGFDPRDPWGTRYPPAERWPDILAERTGWEVVNLGLNGRTIPSGEREIALALSLIQGQLPADCVIILLGTNDALTMVVPSADRIAERMYSFLDALTERFPELTVFLIAPPCVDLPVPHIQDVLWALAPLYQELSETYHTLFAAAPDWELPLAADGVHFTPEAHSRFALQVEKRLRDFWSTKE